jgi:hypothetical protein
MRERKAEGRTLAAQTLGVLKALNRDRAVWHPEQAGRLSYLVGTLRCHRVNYIDTVQGTIPRSGSWRKARAAGAESVQRPRNLCSVPGNCAASRETVQRPRKLWKPSVKSWSVPESRGAFLDVAQAHGEPAFR